MIIQTSRFGEIEIDENLIFNFVEPIIGYDELTKFVLVEHSQNSAFKWLQSIESSDLAFPITTPASFDIDYEFEIPTDKAEKLELDSVDDLISFNIVTIPSDNPKNATINLTAPIIINANNKKGMQLVLSNSDYEVKHKLFA